MTKICTVAARILITALLIALSGFAGGQQAYPTKPIRFILPYAAGGSTSVIGRIVGEKLSESWGQAVIVDNRGGGNTIIGSEALVKSAPDGYTILMVSVAHIINPSLFRTPYDAIKDFAPIATLCRTEQLMVIHPAVPANDLQQLIALAKSRPGELNYASANVGSPTHLAAALFEILAGIKMQHVSYKGGAPALTDLVGGQVQLYFSPPLAALAFIKAGKLKAIAISGTTRSPTLPQVPTFNEAGLPGLDVTTWYGVLAPAGTANAIIGKLSTELARILAMPEIREKLLRQGMEPFISTPDQFGAMMRSDMARWGKVIKAANIKPDQ